jgi:hypothetical protein
MRFVTDISPRTAIIHHPSLGTIRAIGSFRPDERRLFEAQIATWSMRCIYLNGDRYLLQSEYAHFSTGDDWDEEAVEQRYAADLGASQGYNLELATQEEAAAIKQFAVGERETLQRCFMSSLEVDFADNIFSRTIRTCNIWEAASVVANQYGPDAHLVALSRATTRFIDTISRGSDCEFDQAGFHRALMEMAAPELAEQFDVVWPRCRVKLRKQSAPETMIALICELRDVAGGSRGEPYGSANPVFAMSNYLRHCEV